MFFRLRCHHKLMKVKRKLPLIQIKLYLPLLGFLCFSLKHLALLVLISNRSAYAHNILQSKTTNLNPPQIFVQVLGFLLQEIATKKIVCVFLLTLWFGRMLWIVCISLLLMDCPFQATKRIFTIITLPLTANGKNRKASDRETRCIPANKM